jgi:hypothetical protein
MKWQDVDQRWHSRIGAAGLAAVVWLGATPASADDPAVVQLVGMFAAICLERFPDDAAVQKFAADRKLEVMPEPRLRHMLGTDPGMGWLENTPRGQYVLTIELPPYHTCAIRKADSTPPDFLGPFGQLLSGWATSQAGANLKQLPMQTPQIGGVPSQLYGWTLDRGSGKQTETLMAIVSSAGDRVEVRLVRSIQVQ